MDKISVVNNKRANLLFLGLFLLVWSMNGYFIGGNAMKLGLLFAGFTLIVYNASHLKIGKKALGFFSRSIVLLLMYWGIAYYNNQHTLDSTTILFDIVCLLLVNSGYIIAKNSDVLNNMKPKMVVFFCFLTILGAYLFIKYQAVISITEGVNASRVGLQSKSDNVNSVGLAYLNAIVFFLHFNSFTSYNCKKYAKLLLLVAMFCSLFVIFSAGARGAMLFIGIVLFINYFHKLKSLASSISFSFNLIVMVILLVISISVLITFFPVLKGKVESSISRFQNLASFITNTGGDGSASERLESYHIFFNNLESFILFGLEGYRPYPHNQIMEVVMRWGILFGALILVFTIGNFLKGISKLSSNTTISPFQKFFILIFLFSFLQSMTSMSLEMNRILWIGAGFVAGLPSNKKKYI